MLQIAIIDKHPILRKGLDFILKANFNEVSILASESIIAFLKSPPAQNPDLIILGFSESANPNSSMSSVILTKERYPKAAVIVYDDKSDSPMIQLYLKAGVKGYLSKQNDVTKLVECIAMVMDGKRYISTKVL